MGAGGRRLLAAGTALLRVARGVADDRYVRDSSLPAMAQQDIEDSGSDTLLLMPCGDAINLVLNGCQCGGWCQPCAHPACGEPACVYAAVYTGQERLVAEARAAGHDRPVRPTPSLVGFAIMPGTRDDPGGTLPLPF